MAHSLKDTIGALSLALQTRTPCILWGGPGQGKTSAVAALAAQLTFDPVEIVIPVLCEPADIVGWHLYEPGLKRMVFSPAPYIQRLVDAGTAGKVGCLVYDELSGAAPATQAALMRVILEGRVGDVSLPDIPRVAIANPPDQAAGGWPLAPPLANRMLHLQWPNDPPAWRKGVVEGWPAPKVKTLPETWEVGELGWRKSVADFIERFPAKLHAFPKEAAQAGQAWPSPRTWTMLARLLAAHAAVKGPLPVRELLIFGMVGEGVGTEFLAALQAPPFDIGAVLSAPETCDIPTQLDVAMALLSSLVSTLEAHDTEDTYLATWKVVARAATMHGVDVVIPHARKLAAARKKGWAKPEKEFAVLLPALRAAGIIEA